MISALRSRLACPIFGLLGLLAIVPVAGHTTEQTAPNIILIVCDDLGYGDLGLFGPAPQRTPHLQQLAKDGAVLSNFYVTSGVCSPSRSSIMTGSYPRRTNLHQDAQGRWVLFPVGSRGLHPDEVTIAEVLKTQDYATGVLGKWHLGDQPEFLPTRQGFDYWFGIPYSNNMFPGFGSQLRTPPFPPLPLMRNEAVIATEVDQERLTAQLTAEALTFIETHHRKPFFLYLAHPMPHVPIGATENFRGKSANGIYGDAIEELDWSMGQIMAALDDHDIADNTLVIFTSDNGADPRHQTSNLPLRGFKGSTLEGGMRVPLIARWPARIPAGLRSSALTTTMDFLPTFAAIAGIAELGGRVVDGHDIQDILFGYPEAISPYAAFFYYYIDQLQAVRSGPWKLHLAREGNRPRREPEHIPAKLFNLETDVGERINLIDEHPKIVAQLEALAAAMRHDIGDRHIEGANQRPAGHHPNPEPLVKASSPSVPIFVR